MAGLFMNRIELPVSTKHYILGRVGEGLEVSQKNR